MVFYEAGPSFDSHQQRSMGWTHMLFITQIKGTDSHEIYGLPVCLHCEAVEMETCQLRLERQSCGMCSFLGVPLVHKHNGILITYTEIFG